MIFSKQAEIEFHGTSGYDLGSNSARFPLQPYPFELSHVSALTTHYIYWSYLESFVGINEQIDMGKKSMLGYRYRYR